MTEAKTPPQRSPREAFSEQLDSVAATVRNMERIGSGDPMIAARMSDYTLRVALFMAQNFGLEAEEKTVANLDKLLRVADRADVARRHTGALKRQAADLDGGMAVPASVLEVVQAVVHDLPSNETQRFNHLEAAALGIGFIREIMAQHPDAMPTSYDLENINSLTLLGQSIQQ